VPIRQLAEKAFKNNAQQFLKEAFGVTLKLRGHAARAVKAGHREQDSI
jgi:hypothetical protein